MADPETVGFHKGSIATLLKERQELARMVGVVDQLIAAHAKSLKQLGVDLGQKDDSDDAFDKLVEMKNED